MKEADERGSSALLNEVLCPAQDTEMLACNRRMKVLIPFLIVK